MDVTVLGGCMHMFWGCTLFHSCSDTLVQWWFHRRKQPWFVKKKKIIVGFTKKKIQLLLIQHHCFVSSSKLSLGLRLDHLQSCLMPEQVPSCKMGISVSFSCRVIIVTTKAKGAQRGIWELKCFYLMLANIFLTGYGANAMQINYTILQE